jgi:hypothetical protein
MKCSETDWVKFSTFLENALALGPALLAPWHPLWIPLVANRLTPSSTLLLTSFSG